MTQAIEITSASLAYGSKQVFQNLALSIPSRTWTALLGPSGIGKSSLLLLIAGLLPNPHEAKYHIDLNTPSIQHDLAYLSQQDALLPWLTVLENCKLLKRLTGNRIETSRIKSFLRAVHMEGSEKLYPHQLSGGMRQRVSLVRLLLQDKPIILLDEPFQSVDAMTRNDLYTLSTELLRDKTVLFITHDLQDALKLSHHLYFMTGSPAKLTLHTLPPCQTMPRRLDDAALLKAQADLYAEWVNA